VLTERASILLDAIAVLKDHPAIDPEQIGVWCISQAGYIMPLALTMTDDIAFMIVISGPAMDSYDQGAYLLGQLVRCAGGSEEEADLVQKQSSAAEKATTYEEYLENIVPLYENPLLADLGIFRGDRLQTASRILAHIGYCRVGRESVKDPFSGQMVADQKGCVGKGSSSTDSKGRTCISHRIDVGLLSQGE
jgi:hypothetical protein